MGQKEFWDEEERLKKLERKKPSLERLSTAIPWEDFRPLLESVFQQERKSPAGRKRIDVIIMFKMLVLQQLHNLSDGELEFQVNDRRSFERFVGLGAMHSIPDATTVALFKERLRQASVSQNSSNGLMLILRNKVCKPAVAKSLTPPLCRCPSNGIAERRTKTSSRVRYPRPGGPPQPTTAKGSGCQVGQEEWRESLRIQEQHQC